MRAALLPSRRTVLPVVVLLLLAAALLLSCGSLFAEQPAVPTPDASWPELQLERITGGLERPTHAIHAGDGSGRLFVVEKAGRIVIVREGAVQEQPFLDIRDRVGSVGSEQGLLSVAFPPDYASKGYFYVNYTDTEGDTVVARYRLAGEETPDQADPTSEQVLLRITQPYGNHNGGQIAFGPDGYLYIGMGDGGAAGDPQNKAQTTDDLLGKMLRIDVETNPDEATYLVPPDNPFVDDADYAPEIWATGVRNPWRFAFDSETGDMYMADVGQNELEEINVQPASSGGGENYGWRCFEGTEVFDSSAPPCDDLAFRETLTMPVAEYSHDLGCSVTGGFVYRGTAYPALQGIYFYADYCSGRVWGMRQAGDTWETAQLLNADYRIATFGADEAGRLYVLSIGSGELFELTIPSPRALSEAVFLPFVQS
jgi:glucose/arabinose dehydrogenase